MSDMKNFLTHHDDRPDLVGEHPLGDTGQLLLLILFLSVWILDSFFLRISDRFPCLIPLGFRIGISTLLAVTGGILAKKGFGAIFGELRDPPVVVQSSVFGLMRHPLYTAALLLYLALIVATRSILALLAFAGILVFYHRIALYEESSLLTHFGNEYKNYIRDVPRWLPRIRKKR